MEILNSPLPPRQRETPRNAITDHHLFQQIEAAIRGRTLIGEERALLFTEADVTAFGMKAPWRAAVEALRRIIEVEGLPYRADKYRTTLGWVVRVRAATPPRLKGEKVEGRGEKVSAQGA
jgi:hypothetical protein